MSTAANPGTAQLDPDLAEPEELPRQRRGGEALYFAFRNRKLVFGLGVVLFFLAFALVGPWLTDADPFDFGYPTGAGPSSGNWFGTTAPGQDVYTQFVHGLRASFLVGALAGCVATAIAMLIGFTCGYRGGIVDELLSMLTKSREASEKVWARIARAAQGHDVSPINSASVKRLWMLR